MYREVILRELWSDLDDCVYRLKTDGVPTEDSPNEEWRLYGNEQGRALGLALAIAKIDNLSEPDLEAVRRQAMERWEAYLDEQEPTPIGPSRNLGRRSARSLADHRGRDRHAAHGQQGLGSFPRILGARAADLGHVGGPQGSRGHGHGRPARRHTRRVAGR